MLFCIRIHDRYNVFTKICMHILLLLLYTIFLCVIYIIIYTISFAYPICYSTLPYIGMLGGDGSGVRDSVVNQLLAKMDGIKVKRSSVLYYMLCGLVYAMLIM